MQVFSFLVLSPVIVSSATNSLLSILFSLFFLDRGLVHVVQFERLQKDPLSELRKIVDYLNIEKNFVFVNESDARFKCVESHLSGRFRRTKTPGQRAEEEQLFDRLGMRQMITEKVAYVNALVTQATDERARLLERLQKS